MAMNVAIAAASEPHILVVDDDAGLRQHISAYLAEHSLAVEVAQNAAEMEQILSTKPIEVVVLDVMMPGEDGLSICRRLAARNGPPVIMLSAMGEEVDRIVGLELGADDYLAKPCNPRELLARIRAVLRRREEGGGRLSADLGYSFAGFQLDMSRRQLKAPNGVLVLLTAGEFALLLAFLAHPNRVLSRDELLERARGGEADVFDRAIDVQISRLRRKLHACTERELILTYRGSGYMFDADVRRP
jgi:two-component system OmpR family response regulator